MCIRDSPRSACLWGLVRFCTACFLHAVKTNMLKLLIKAPKAFWTIGLVQFFCWFAFMFMWTYTNGSIAANAFDAPTVEHLVDGVTKVVLDTKSLQYQNAAD